MTPSRSSLTYAVITPARDEAANLQRLSTSLLDQRDPPSAWVIVDNGSTDATAAVGMKLAREHAWISLVPSEPKEARTRAEPIVDAFHAGLARLSEPVDVLVKLDADMSMSPFFFSQLLNEFVRDPSLGIASGTCFEEQPNGTWRQRHGTGSGVWGGCRGYRWDCLQSVLPLEPRMGWDTIDLIKAQVQGWRTTAFLELPFRHHRVEGVREGRSSAHWAAQGDTARYMGYRFSYLLVRTCYRALRDPSALAMLMGYVRAAVRREPVCPDRSVRAYVRRQQRARQLPDRIREALRPRHHLQSDG